MKKVAIVGRPNVGKSTLFNRLVGRRQAIVSEIPGTTRDRIQEIVEWDGKTFLLIDTGGLVPSPEDEIEEHIKQQVKIAIDESDLILFLVDGQKGLTSWDENIALDLQKSSKEVIVVVNKLEDKFDKGFEWEFYQLGFESIVPISALHGSNSSQLLDLIMEKLKNIKDEEIEEEILKIAVVGRPNVGKSTFINALLNQNRLIVSQKPGTTRDSIDCILKTPHGTIKLIDTAGIRKKPEDKTEYWAFLRTQRAIARADIVFFMIDASEGITHQDQRIAGLIKDNLKNVIILFNKWDLTEKSDEEVKRLNNLLLEKLYFISWAPIFRISAKNKLRVSKPIQKAFEVYEKAHTRIDTSTFNSFLQQVLWGFPMPSYRGKKLKVMYGTQVDVNPPVFVIFVNDKQLVKDNLINYIEKQIRENWDFEGVPIFIKVRQSKR